MPVFLSNCCRQCSSLLIKKNLNPSFVPIQLVHFTTQHMTAILMPLEIFPSNLTTPCREIIYILLTYYQCETKFIREWQIILQVWQVFQVSRYNYHPCMERTEMYAMATCISNVHTLYLYSRSMSYHIYNTCISLQ